MAQLQSTYLPAYTPTPINGSGGNEGNEIAKLKINSNSISAFGGDCDDVAKVVFRENAVITNQQLYVNNDQVVVNSQNFFLDSSGNVNAPKAKIESLNANGITVNSLKVAGSDPLLRSNDLDFDPTTGTLTVKNLKVKSDIQVLQP